MFDRQIFSRFQAKFTPTSYIYALLNRTIPLEQMVRVSLLADPVPIYDYFRKGCILLIEEKEGDYQIFDKPLEELIHEIQLDGTGAGEFLSRRYPNILLDIQNLSEMATLIMTFRHNENPDHMDYVRHIHLMIFMISPELYTHCIHALIQYANMVEPDAYSRACAVEAILNLSKETPAMYELMNADPVELGDTILLKKDESIRNWRIQLPDYFPIDYMTVLKNFCQCVRWNLDYYFVTPDYSSNDVMESIIGNDDTSILIGIYHTEHEVIKFTLVENDHLIFNDPKDTFILDMIRKQFSIAEDETDTMRHNESTCVLYMSTKADFHYQNIYLNTFQKDYFTKKCYFLFNETATSALEASSSIISFVYDPLHYTSKMDIHLERNRDKDETTIDVTYANYRLVAHDGSLIYLRKIYRIEFTYVSRVMLESIIRLIRESASQIWTHRLPLYHMMKSIHWQHKPKTIETLRQSTTNHISKKFSVLNNRVSLTMANTKFTTTKDNRPVYSENLDHAISLTKTCIKNRQRYIKMARQFSISDEEPLEKHVTPKTYWLLDMYRDHPDIMHHDNETIHNSIYVPYYVDTEQGVRHYNVCTLHEFIGCVNILNAQMIVNGTKASTIEEKQKAMDIMQTLPPSFVADMMSRTYRKNFYAISFGSNPPKSNVINNHIIVNRLTGGIILHTRSTDVEMSNININDFDLNPQVIDHFNRRIASINHNMDYYSIYHFDIRYATRTTFKKYIESFPTPTNHVDRYMVCKEEMFGFTNDEIKKTFEEPDYDTKIHIKYLEYLTQSTIIVFEYNAATDTLDFEFSRHSLYHSKKIMYNTYLYVIKVSYVDGTFNYVFPCQKSMYTYAIPIFTDYIMNIYNRRCIRVALQTDLPARLDVTVHKSSSIQLDLLTENMRAVGQLLDEHGKVHAFDVMFDGGSAVDPSKFVQEHSSASFGMLKKDEPYFTVTLNHPVDFDIYLPVHERYKYFPMAYRHLLPQGDIISMPRMPKKHLIGEIGFVLYNEFSINKAVKIDLAKVQFVVMTMASLVLWVSFKNNIPPENVVRDFVDIIEDDDMAYHTYLKQLEQIDILPNIKKSVFASHVDPTTFFNKRILLPKREYKKFMDYVRKELPYGSKHFKNQGFAFYMENISIRAADVMYMISLRNSKKHRSSWYPIISIDDPKITMTSLENKSSRLLRNNSDECMMIKMNDPNIKLDFLYGTVKDFVDSFVNNRNKSIHHPIYVGVTNKATGTNNPYELARATMQDTSIKFMVIPVPPLKESRPIETIDVSFRSLKETETSSMVELSRYNSVSETT